MQNRPVKVKSNQRKDATRPAGSVLERLVSKIFVPGDIVKIIRGNVNIEKFWVVVVMSCGRKCVGRVDSNLVFTDEHGLSFGDTIVFTSYEVIDVYCDC